MARVVLCANGTVAVVDEDDEASQGGNGANPRYVNNGDSRTNQEKNGDSGDWVSPEWAVGQPFVDYLNVSFDKGELLNVSDAVLGVVRQLGVVEGPAGTWRAVVGGGVLKLGERGRVAVVSASGALCELLRSWGLWGEYLGVLGRFPHRVTLLHATCDFLVESPGAVVREVRRRAYAGELALTRKRLSRLVVRTAMAAEEIGADGVVRETGTVYLGSRANADVWAKVYDKRAERLAKGAADPGPVVRVEIAVQSDAGATLRDAFEPVALFWHYGRRLLRCCPADAPVWVAHGEGFTVSQVERAGLSVSERLWRMWEASADVQALVNVARAEVGGEADAVYALLAPGLLKRCRQSPGVVGPAGAPDATAAVGAAGPLPT